MIKRLLIAFEDFLGSSIASQVMPPWNTLTQNCTFAQKTLSKHPKILIISDISKNLNFKGSKIEGEFDDVCTWMVQRTYKGKFHFCRGIVGKNV